MTSVTSASRAERRPRPQRLRGARAGAEPRSPRSLPTSRLASRRPQHRPGLPVARGCAHRDRGIAELRRRRRHLCPDRYPRCCRRGRRAGLREGTGGDGRCRRRERARASTAAPLGQVRGGAGTRGAGPGSGGRGRDEGAGPERLRTKLYQQRRRGARSELGPQPIGELSARAGGRSGAVLDQWETGKGGEGGAGVGGRRGWSKRRGLGALIRVARIAIGQRPARQQPTRRRGADSGPRAANGRAQHGAGEMTSVNQAPGD